MKYSNAGHEPPIIVRGDCQPEILPVPEGFLLGVEEESRYQTMETVLEPEDTAILYTDGVTEAVNASGELYALANLLETVRYCSSPGAAEISKEILQSVKRFSSGIAQADDITVLALCLTGSKA